MPELPEFKNIHEGNDIYILASGKSVDFIDNSFFKNKIIIGINQAYKKIKCQYLVRKEFKLSYEVIKANPDCYIFISKGSSGELNDDNKSISASLETDEKICLFNHLQNKRTHFKFPEQDNYLVVSYSTITTGIHLAAYMGAKNIILVGHDCGTLNGKPNFNGYHTKDTYQIAHKQGKSDYIKWLKKIENQTIKLKQILKKKYNCNVYSLNPFINFGLEGNRYKK